MGRAVSQKGAAKRSMEEAVPVSVLRAPTVIMIFFPMVLTALLAVKVKTKTLTAGNRGFTLLENASSEISGNYLTKADGGIKPLSKHTVKVRSSQTGFTLFELLLVLFIIGLAAAVVMSSGSRMQEKYNVQYRGKETLPDCKACT